MLHVELENIYSEEVAAGKIQDLVKLVDETKQLVVITRQSKNISVPCPRVTPTNQ